MKDITKKVVILNNLSSPYICEAIIVLKDYNPRLESKVIADAEKIVTDYIENMKKNEQIYYKSAQKSKKSLLLCLAVSLAIIIALGCKVIAG